MLKSQNIFIILALAVLVTAKSVKKDYDEEAGRDYLKQINAESAVKTTESVIASWGYESNITDENLQHQLEVSARLANWTKEVWEETIKYPWQTFQDPDIKRQFKKLSVLGSAALSPEKYELLDKTVNDMQGIYGKAKVCDYYNRTNCELQLEPEITERLVKSRDPEELKYLWEEWRKASGQKVRDLYVTYVNLSNEAAVLNNFSDTSAFWLKDYEADDFKDQIEDLWQQLRPLYLQLHAYVRRRLREQYGEDIVSKKGPIPAHLLGNMWAQTWGNILDFSVPYPDKPSVDVTPNMIEQGYTPLKMFKLAEEFFVSLNLSNMPETFWKNSIIEKPNDGRDLICHASAWDFYDGKDFRIKMCAVVSMEDLQTVHHEMGHVEYYLQYKGQPFVYKDGANPGFHEAVGDVMALSVSTPKHLRKIGLLNSTEDDAETDINQLYSMALDKIAFLPFGYLMDQWRWSVFQGETSSDGYNCKWWELREKYQGLEPPSDRSENDFDPGAKYHIVASVEYIRYFVSFVIQFQFHRSLCTAAGEFDPQNPSAKPLHQCDIYQSQEAGALLAKMLQMGSSKPWQDAMEVITGQRKMDAGALLQYFAALQEWLEKENERTGEYIGWEPTKRQCTNTRGKNEEMTPKKDGAIPNLTLGLVYLRDEYDKIPDDFGEDESLPHTIFRRSIDNKIYIPKKKLTRSNEKTRPSRKSFLKLTDKERLFKEREKRDVNLECLADVLAEEMSLAKTVLNHPGQKDLLKRYISLRDGQAETLKKKCILRRSKKSKEKEKKIKEQLQAKIKELEAKEREREREKENLKPDKHFDEVVSKEDEKKEPSHHLPDPDPHNPSAPAENPHNPSALVENPHNPSAPVENPHNPSAPVENPHNPSAPVENPQKIQEKPQIIMHSFSVEKPDVDLIWNAEMVKNQAQQTLKNLKYMPSHFRNPKFGSQKNVLFLKEPQCCGMKRSQAQATVSMEPGSERHIADVKERLESLQNILKTAGLISSNAQNKNDVMNSWVSQKYEKRSGRDKDSYVVLINDENPFQKKKKRSYREFHYNVRTPVNYNSIVIQGCKNKKGADEKPVKAPTFRTDDTELRKRKRASKHFGEASKKFFKSVRRKRNIC